MWQTLVGAGALVVCDDRILMVLHKRGGKYRWELPSGFTKPGESLEQAAIREVLEETAVTVCVGRFLCTVVMDVPDDNYRGINAYFCATSVGQETPRFIGSDDEPIIDAAYIDLTKMKGREIHPVDRKILARWTRDPNTPPFYFRMLF